MLCTFLPLALMFSSPVFAKNSAAKAGEFNLPPQNPGCGAIRAACKNAGYGGNTPGPKNLGPVRDCLQKWNDGESIPGITIKPTDPAGMSCAMHQSRVKTYREREAEAKKPTVTAKAPSAAPGDLSAAPAPAAPTPPPGLKAPGKPAPPAAPAPKNP